MKVKGRSKPPPSIIFFPYLSCIVVKRLQASGARYCEMAESIQ